MRRRLHLLLPALLLGAVLLPPAAATADPSWEAVARINVGGPRVGGFEADTRLAPNAAGKGARQTADWGGGVRRGPTTPDDVPMAIFSTERWDGSPHDRMRYKWAVEDGRYRIRLHFAENYRGTQRTGARTYHVWSEGRRLLTDHDVFAAVGARTSLTETFEVDVTDGLLRVTFDRRRQNPRLMGIEVDRAVEASAEPQPPRAPEPPDPGPTPPPPAPEPPTPTPPAPAPPPPATGTCNGVTIAAGADWDAVLDAHPAGTTYCVAAGTHRLVQVVPEHGDRFVGAGRGRTVVSGAKDLSADAVTWTRSGNRWYVGGQDQQAEQSPNCVQSYCRLVDGGNPLHLSGEEFFVDDQRWDEVASLSAVDRPGEWFLDRAADRIWIAADPGQLGRIETSVLSGAFGGNGVRKVEIRHMTIEKYATYPQFGAVGFWRQHTTYDWTLQDVEVAHNAAGGITIGPGMTIDGCHVHHNGQLGIGGSGKDRWTGATYTAPVTIRNCEISHSPVLDFDWGWEAGATKIKHATDATVERNWVHHAPVGIWFDVFNRGAVVRDNLVEDIQHLGIFYEISTGPAVIERNMVRRVGDHSPGPWDDVSTWHAVAGIQASNSEGVTIRDNSVDDAGNAISFVDKGRGNGSTAGLRDAVATGNDVRMLERPGGAGTVGFHDLAAQNSGNRYADNTYRTAGDLRVWRVDGNRVDFSTWQRRAEPGARLLTDGSRPGWPSGYTGPRGG